MIFRSLCCMIGKNNATLHRPTYIEIVIIIVMESLRLRKCAGKCISLTVNYTRHKLHEIWGKIFSAYTCSIDYSCFSMKWIVIFVISLISNKTVIAAKKSGHHPKRQQNQHSNISKLLDKLLENYVNVQFDVFMWLRIFYV